MAAARTVVGGKAYDWNHGRVGLEVAAEGDNDDNDAVLLRRWLDWLSDFNASLSGLEGDSPLDFCESASDAWHSGFSPDSAPPPGSPAMVIIVETARSLAQAMNSVTRDHYETPDVRDRVTRAEAEQSLREALEGLLQEGETWLNEVMPTAEQIRQRLPVTGATFTAALDAGAHLGAELDADDAEAEADPYGPILIHRDPSRSDAPIIEKVDSFTEAEHNRYLTAYRALEKMLEADLFQHLSDESDRLCEVVVDVITYLRTGEMSLADTDAIEERRRKLRSALLSFTNAIQILEEQMIRRAEETFGRFARETRSVRRLFRDLKKASFDYRWLRVQGDVLRHVDINAFKCNFAVRLRGEPAVVVDVDRRGLLEYTKWSWKKPWLKRSELQAMDSDPSVLTMIQNIQPFIRDLHSKIETILYPDVAHNAEVVRELIGRFEGRRGMYAIQTGPGFTQRVKAPPFRLLAPHVLAFADCYQAG
ncbi:hypothetical protein NJB1507_08340 [Mycobacterium marinum]|nr:hypothetical protein NJB1507_08340 [Mycobacterium marinum]